MTAKSVLSLLVIVWAGLTVTGCGGSAMKTGPGEIDSGISDKIKESLVFLNISTYVYNQTQPWKSPDITENFGYGCAVGPNVVLTTAANVANAAFIKARCSGQNEFIPAGVKLIDHERGLCLLQLDAGLMTAPLTAVTFHDNYKKGAPLASYWLSAGGHLTTGRGYLDRAEISNITGSFTGSLNYIAGNTSHSMSKARLYCMGEKPIGLACWANGDSKETGIIPAATINAFLADAGAEDYHGMGVAGFDARNLIDPAMRAYLKMPADLKHGIYVSKVFTLGTGSDVLRQGDVILAIDGKTIDPYGRYLHPKLDRISYNYLIGSHNAGDTITFDLWRDGEKMQSEPELRNFKASEMLVPRYHYGEGPEYIVTAGFVLQKLTRDYFTIWGDNWPGKAPAHLYHYYRDLAFNPASDRKDIVILSYVLPADINMGYQGLGQMVIDTFNGLKITSLADIPQAQKLNPHSKYDIIEFEHDYPTVVIDRAQLKAADARIAETYGIQNLVNIKN